MTNDEIKLLLAPLADALDRALNASAQVLEISMRLHGVPPQERAETVAFALTRDRRRAREALREHEIALYGAGSAELN